MIFTKPYNETWLFLINAVNMGGLVLLMVLCIGILDDFSNGRISAKQCCARLNVWEVVTMILQGNSAFLLAMQHHHLFLIFDFLQLGWRLFNIIMNITNGIYVEENIVLERNSHKYKQSYYRYSAYYGVMMFICVMRVYDYVRTNHNTTNWYPMWDPSIVQSAVMYIFMMVFVYAIVVVVAYSHFTLADFEVENADLLTLCKRMNSWAVARLLLHSALSGILMVYGYLFLFIVNSAVILYEIIENTDTKVPTIGLHDPVEIMEPEEIPKFRKLYKLYMGYFVTLFYACSFLLVKELAEPYVFDFAHINRLLVFAGGVMIPLPFAAFIIIVCYQRYCDKNDTEVKWACTWLKVAFYLNTILHFHLCGFFVAYNEFALLLLNMPLVYMETTVMLGDMCSVADMQDEAMIDKNVTRFTCYLCVYLGYCIFYVLLLPIKYKGPSALEAASVWFKFQCDFLLMIATNITLDLL